MVCYSTMRGMFKNMPRENASAPKLAFSIIEIVDLINHIFVANPSLQDARRLVVFMEAVVRAMSSTQLS